MPGATVFIVAALYASLLFILANWAKERGNLTGARAILSPRSRVYAFSLALAVYCTSWTFFGAVGSAVAEGWPYLPIYLGPILLFIFGISFLERLIEAVKQEGATSISHFIGSRFSNSRGVAALVTILALLGTVPYLALQLRSVGASFVRLAGENDPTGPMALTAITLAVFSMLFGTRSYEVASRNDGVLFSIAAESIVKLFAFIAIGFFSIIAFFGSPPQAQSFAIEKILFNFNPSRLNIDFFVLGFLASIAVICLPRQFYIGVIQADDSSDINKARWPFVAYLIFTTLIAIPIAIASFALLPSGYRADLIVIDMPLHEGQTLLALIVFLGGFSAATGMVIVETIALSTMVSNDLIAPILLKNSKWAKSGNFGNMMLLTRRIMIVVLMGVAFIYATKIPAGERLASIGLIAFAAVAQFAPSLILSVYGPNRDPIAAKAGLSAGLLVWSYTLFLPNILDDSIFLPLQGSILDPSALFKIDGLSHISHGTLWSMGFNICVHAIVAARTFRTSKIGLKLNKKISVQQVSNLHELVDLVGRFVGKEQAEAKLLKTNNDIIDIKNSIDRVTARTAERMIASVIGAPSARALMSSALSGSSLTISDITQMLDHSGQSLQFSKDLLGATLEHIDPGVSVVDRNLNLVAWNSRYLDLFNYPPGMVRVGAPVAELIRYNALRGECGPGEVENHVERRLNHMRRRNRHAFERVRDDGRVFKTVGGPMPGGGYVMCFTDITSEANARLALEKSRTELEIRVGQRTAELSRANRALAQATADKTRFLAAASHDLLQPLHAARLFTAALQRQIPEEKKSLVLKIDQSIEAGEKLLRRLLDISKLDAGGVISKPRIFSLHSKLSEVVDIFKPVAAEKGLKLSLGKVDGYVNTDPTLFRSIVQNFVSNAVRYTKSGGVLVGVRKRGNIAIIQVWDTGNGIPKAKQEQIFKEFERLESNEEGGIGLGLSIVERTARLLGANISLQSKEGKGSCFSVSLPLCENETIEIIDKINSQPEIKNQLIVDKNEIITEKVPKKLNLMIVDDDINVCEAMSLLVKSLGHDTKIYHKYRDAIEDKHDYDAYLLDYDLGAGANGFDLANHLKSKNPIAKIAIISANTIDEFSSRLKYEDIPILRKPLKMKKFLKWLEN